MDHADGAAGTGRAEALLWAAAPTGPLPAPPVDTRAQLLPISDLQWDDAERLFVRLLDTVQPLQFVKLFGIQGQAQAGIDAYARLSLDLSRDRSGRDYVTLQSRRVRALTPANIRKAVDDLLNGEWAERTAAFYYATSFDLQDTKFDAAIREQTERLAELRVAFVPWGLQEVSALLKDRPRLVDDFFGRAWVERFCGQEAAQGLADTLTRTLAPKPLELAAAAPRRPVGQQRVAASHRVGLVPAPAASFQQRDGFHEDVRPGETIVLTGLGGVGKTQLAADFVRAYGADSALVVWVTASSRDQVLATYAEAARAVLGQQDSVELAAERFLAWLATAQDSWVIVLDDLQAPADLRGLWPRGPAGRAAVTTRRRDAALAGSQRRVVDVDVFSAVQAVEYLQSALQHHPLADDIDGVVDDLQRLPLALAQAAAFMIDRQLRCSQYRRRFADRRKHLIELLPEPGALPDEHRDTVAATWSLSMDVADNLPPAGVSRALMELLSVLDSDSIPAGLVTGHAAQNWLSYAVYERAGAAGALVPIGIDTFQDGLRTLHRLSLLRHDGDSVRVHSLVQRVTREGLDADCRSSVVWAAADLLLEYWHNSGRRSEFALRIRANVDALRRHDQGELIQSTVHPILIVAGVRQGELGDPLGAADYFDNLLVTAIEQLPPHHPKILELRGHAARWRAAAGDPVRAIAVHEELLGEFQRNNGFNDPGTIVVRATLAILRARTGALARGIHEMEQVLVDCERLFGPRNIHTLDARTHLAGMYEEAGKREKAGAMFAQLTDYRTEASGPDHRDTLTAQGLHARSINEGGDPQAAIPLLRRLLETRMQELGDDDPDTLATRSNLAQALQAAGEVREAAEELEIVRADHIRVMGPDHPQTLTARHNHLLGTSLNMGKGEAESAWMELIDDSSRVLSPLAPETLSSMHNFGEWLAYAGDLENAIKLLQETLAGRTEALGAEHPDTKLTQKFLDRVQGATRGPSSAMDR